MIGLPIVVLQLPVRLKFPVFAQSHATGTKILAIEQLDHGTNMLAQRRCIAVHIHENPVVPNAAAHRYEAVFLLVKTALLIAAPAAVEIGRRFELAVEVIGPGMIGAGQRRQPLAWLGQDECGTMTADIVERLHLALLAADENDRQPAHRNRHRITGIWDIALETDAHPSTAEHALLLKFEELVAGVGRARQSPRIVDRSAQRLNMLFANNLF